MPQHLRSLPTRQRWLYNLMVSVEHLVSRSEEGLVLGPMGNRLHRRLADRMAERGPGRVVPVPERETLERRSFRDEFERPGVPVVVRGFARDWPAVQNWDFDWLAEHYGTAPVLLRESEGTSGERVSPDERSLPMGQFIEETRAGAGRYIRFSSFLDEHPELLEHFDVDTLHELRGASPFGCAYKAFIGGAGTTTQMHAAMTSNFLVLVEGRKHWRLHPGSHAAALRMPASRGNVTYSYADPNQLDVERFPALQYTDSYEVTMEEGDLLYVPPFMFHQVSNLSDSIALSYRSGDLRGALLASPTMTLLRALSPEEPIWERLLAFRQPAKLYRHGYQARGEPS